MRWETEKSRGETEEGRIERRGATKRRTYRGGNRVELQRRGEKSQRRRYRGDDIEERGQMGG